MACVICQDNTAGTLISLDCNYKADEKIHLDCISQLPRTFSDQNCDIVTCPLCRQSVILKYTYSDQLGFNWSVKYFIWCIITISVLCMGIYINEKIVSDAYRCIKSIIFMIMMFGIWHILCDLKSGVVTKKCKKLYYCSHYAIGITPAYVRY